jgi:hypothetical protein
MNTVVPFKRSPYVLLEAGRCTGGDTPSLIGRWIFIVSFVDADGGHLVDYVGSNPVAADAAAVSWARDMGCRIIDTSAEESA